MQHIIQNFQFWKMHVTNQRPKIISEQYKMEVINKLRGMPTYLLKEVVAFLQQRMVLESHCTLTWPLSSLECWAQLATGPELLCFSTQRNEAIMHLQAQVYPTWWYKQWVLYTQLQVQCWYHSDKAFITISCLDLKKRLRSHIIVNNDKVFTWEIYSLTS